MLLGIFSYRSCYGGFKGRLDEIFNETRNVWFESVEGLRINNRKMIALDIDEALWHLSKYSCSKRNDKTGKCRVFKQCEANKFCINGKIDMNKDFLNLNT